MAIRTAQPADALAVARVHVRSWQAAYRGLLPAAYLDGLRAEDRAATYDLSGVNSEKPCTLVAEADGSIAGFATTMPARDPELAGFGELCALYVDPDQWGKGIGLALIQTARARLAAMGFAQAALWVLDGNLRAERFYRNDGWVSDGARRTIPIWGVTVNESRYTRSL